MSDSRKKVLSYAVAAAILVGFAVAMIPLFGSLKPSAKADAVRAQGRFSASQLDDLTPGEVRLVETGIGIFWVVVPTDEMMSDLDRAANYAAYRPYDTFDDQLGAFVLWPVSPKNKGVPCSVQHMEKDPSGEGILKFGGFFDPCSGSQFDYAGRVSIASSNRNVRNLKRLEFERISADTYQITNLEYLFRDWQ